jgi:hypothetical protein
MFKHLFTTITDRRTPAPVRRPAPMPRIRWYS